MDSYKILQDEIKEIKIINTEGIEETQTIITKYIQRQSDLAIIPCILGNKDYEQYLVDVENGAEVTDFDYNVENLRQILAQEQLIKDTRIQEIKTELNNLDLKAIRPLLDNETYKVEEIKSKKLLLREELQTLLI